eukprot:TCONS_00048979-protein
MEFETSSLITCEQQMEEEHIVSETDDHLNNDERFDNSSNGSFVLSGLNFKSSEVVPDEVNIDKSILAECEPALVESDGECEENKVDDDEETVYSSSEDDIDDEHNNDDGGIEKENSEDAFIPKIINASGFEESTPIFEGSNLSLGVSIMLIMTFIMRHHISGVALVDLLSLIELHMVSKNVFTASMKFIRKCFSKVRGVITLHYHCKECLAYIGTENIPCTICKPTVKKNGYFIVIPLLENLQSLFLYEGFLDNLQYPVSRKKLCPSNIEDIIDGEVYQKHFSNDGFLKGTPKERKTKEIHISLQINTDGVSLFKSSKIQIWPIYYTINELNPKLRYQRKYRLFAGLWFDKKKPDFKSFLRPFTQELIDFGNKGEMIKTTVGEKLVKVYLLSGVFDAPAKSQFQNIVQFNGEYGCSYCLEPGKTVKVGTNGRNGHTHSFPFNFDSETGHTKMRTHSETVVSARKAQNDMMQTGKESKCLGVKGVSWPMILPRFDLINGLGLDYLHNTLLGVVKMLIKLWFKKQYKSEAWYIGDGVKQIDRDIACLKLPNLISRVPRNIDEELKQWKASEYRSFLLFYSAPILANYLPSEYFVHYCCLVQGIFLLLQDCISLEDLKTSSNLLLRFCMQIERLYGERYNTYNVHNLLHMGNSVKQLGPLWAQSTFWYEDYNGDYKHLFYGTQSVDMQIVTNTIIQHRIPEIARSLLPGSLGYTLYTKMTVNCHQLVKNTGEKIALGVNTVGNFFCFGSSFPEKAIVDHLYSPIQDLKLFKRIYFKGNVIHCQAYTRVTKRNSFTISYNGRYGKSFGFVKYFLKLIKEGNVEYLAVVDMVKLESDAINVGHMVKISKECSIDICKIIDISEICCFVSCPSGDYIARFPNKLEND